MVTPITPGSPITPPGGFTSPSFSPLISPDTSDPAPALSAGQFTPVSSKPQLGTLQALGIIGSALAVNKTQQVQTQAQSASLRKSFDNANAQGLLTQTQQGALLLQLQLDQLNIAEQLNSILAPVNSAVTAENQNVATENQHLTAMNTALQNWNTARDTYESDPSPANLATLNAATTAYSNARSTYESFIGTRNQGISDYNSSVASAEAQLGPVNALITQANVINAELGLSPFTPAEYDLDRTPMADAPATPDIFDPTDLPPDLIPIPSPRTQVNITAPSIDTAAINLANAVLAYTQILIQSSIIGRFNAQNSAANFEYQVFNIQQKPNAAVAAAYAQKSSVPPSQESSGVGSSPILNAISTSTANVATQYSPGIGEDQAAVQLMRNDAIHQDNNTRQDKFLSSADSLGQVNINQIKLNAAIYVRQQEGSGLSINNPSMQVALGLETVSGIQNSVNSGALSSAIDGLTNQVVNGNPELDQTTAGSLTAALKIHYALLSTHELAEALGDPNISTLLLLATPGLENLQSQLSSSAYTNADDLLTTPTNQATIGLNLADQLNKEADLDPQEAVAVANVVVRSLEQQPLQNLQDFKTALTNSLLASVNPAIASKVTSTISAQITEDRKAATLDRPLTVAASRQQAIVNQVTSNTNQRTALLNALNSQFATANGLKNNAAAALVAAGLTAAQASDLSDKLTRIAVLDTAVQTQFNARATHLSPGERTRLQTAVTNFVRVPQKAAVTAQQDRANPLSIPSQIANQLAIIKAHGNTRLNEAVEQEITTAARETYGDFVQRKRADAGTLYLHQTQNAGSPFVGTSALPKTNFGNPPMPLGTQAA